jgi:hypothetical protein
MAPRGDRNFGEIFYDDNTNAQMAGRSFYLQQTPQRMKEDQA